jgi:hypothetical protein
LIPLLTMPDNSNAPEILDGPAGPAGKKQVQEAHPVATAIDGIVHRARDIKVAAGQFLPNALKARKRAFEKIERTLTENAPLLEDPDSHVSVLAQKSVHEALARFYRLRSSRVPEVLERGLFLALFSAFDAFTGDLLRGLYARKPELYAALNKSVSFADVLAASSLHDLKRQVLDEDVESLRRESYVDQFTGLQKRFDVKLTDFDRWPEFVECSQRRNLITHCDGVVTDQYLKVCRDAGIVASQLPASGSRVTLGAKYFFSSCELILEVGLKLGQTLWRKTLPSELGESEAQLMRMLYEALENSNWSRARVIGEFAFGQRKTSSDFNKKIVVVNYAQALKRSGATEESRKLLEGVDWTAAANDFKLAKAVLLDDYSEATGLVRRIGTKGDLIDEASYHTWPLFIEFRETDAFALAYADVFGHPYAVKLRREADEASKRAAEEAQLDQPDRVLVNADASPEVPEPQKSREGLSLTGESVDGAGG